MSLLRRILPLLLLTLLPSTLAAQDRNPPTRNVTLFDHIEPVTTALANGQHSSCWGYTAPDGREYAFFASQIGTSIIDITTKPIVEVAFIPGPHSAWREIKTYRNYAYITTENRSIAEGAGVQIVDLTALPDTAHLIRTDTTSFISAHTIWIDDHYLYAMGTRAEAGVNGGALILDLEPDPLHPRKVGGVDPQYYHDAFIRNDTLVGAAVNGDGADIYDVSDKAAPVLLGQIRYPFAGTHNAELTEDGRYVVTSDEIDFTAKTLKVWDISDPDDIVMAAEYSPNLVETIHNVRVRGRYAYVAWYTAGVRIVDLIDPRHPREVGFIDTYGGADGGFSGVWEVYPHFPSGKIIASDRNSGLYVFTFNGARAASLSGTITDRGSGRPITDAVIDVEGRDSSLRSTPSGSYYIGAVEGDTLHVRVSAPGHYDTSLTVRVQGDSIIDITLDSAMARSYRIGAVDQSTGLPLSGFTFAVDGRIASTDVAGADTTIVLTDERSHTLILGRWGHHIARATIDGARPSLILELERGYQDDASLDLGWSYAADEDNAVTGRWNRIVPYLGYPRSDWVHPPSEPSGGSGSIFFTGRPPRFAPPESNDINSGRTSLTSPPMDLSDHGDPAIFLDRWYVHFERDTLLDSLVAEISNDNGRTWSALHTEVKGKTGWKRLVLFPGDHVRLTDSMLFRLRASDTLGNTLVVAGMDNFEVVDRVFSGVPVGGGSGGGSMLRVHPNPSIDDATLHFLTDKEMVSITIRTLDGRVIATYPPRFYSTGRHSLALPASLASGTYIITMRTSEGTTSVMHVRL